MCGMIAVGANAMMEEFETGQTTEHTRWEGRETVLLKVN